MSQLSDIGNIKSILSRYGFSFSKSLGQNFLVNPGVCPRMAEECGAREGVCALEIGPGIGVLTYELARRADKVAAIELDRRLLRDFEENANRDFHNVLEGLVPRLMVPVLVERTGIPAAEKVHSVTKAQRRRLLEVLKCLRIDIQGPRPVEEAIVTSGGIKVSEINPTTLESKKAPGVYFAGEVLDVDAYTGGFNLQIAWSTGHAAGEAAAQDIGGINP